MNFRPSGLLDRFELLEQVGSGAEAVVFRARDRHSGDEVAIKTFPSGDRSSRDQLRRDFRVICELAVPELPRVYEMFDHDGRTVVVMELFHGQDVERMLGSGLLDPMVVARGLLSGLAAMHERGIVHGDVKPSNLLIRDSGEVVLADLGLSRRAERGWSGLVGTPDYFSPERLRWSPATPASDMFAAGMLLREVLCGASLTAKRRSDLHTAAALGSPLPSFGGGDDELANLVDEMLHPDPERRPSARQACLQLGLVSSGDDLFVGREDELSRLRSWWHGHGGIAVVRGPSGIGKTGLVHRFVAGLRSAGTLVLRSRCHPNARVPFHCFESVVDDLATDIETLSTEHRRVLRAAFPFLVTAPAEEASMSSRIPQPGELARALRSLLDTVGRGACWVIDDVQWMDPDSERVLLGLPGAPVRIILVGREGESSLLDRLEQDAERLLLGPLAESEAVAWLERTTPLANPTEVRERASRSGGSPLLLNLLAAAGPGMDVDGAWRARLTGLSKEARAALVLLTVVGVPMKVQDLLAVVSELPRWSLLRELEDADLVRWVLEGESRRIVLRHARVADALGDVDEASRDAIFRSLERTGVEPLLLASLYRGAGAHDRCAPFAWRAVEEALQRGAFAIAIDWCGYLLQADSPVVDRADLLDALARAHAGLGRTVEAARILEQACDCMSEGVPEARRRAAAALFWLGAGHAVPGLTQLRRASRGLGLPLPNSRFEAGVRTVLDGLRLATRAWTIRSPGCADPATLARLEAAKAATGPLTFLDYSTAVALITRYLRLSLEAGNVDHACRAAALAWNGLAQTGGSVAQRERLLAFLAEHVPHASREVQAFVESTRAYVAIYSDRLSSSIEMLDRALAMYDAHRGDLWDLPFTRVQRLIARHFIEPCTPEWAAEVDGLRDGLEENGNLLCSSMLDMGVGYAVDVYRGAPDAAVARVERAGAVFDVIPSAYAWMGLFARVRIALAEGKLDVASEALGEPPLKELMGVQHVRVGYYWLRGLVAAGRVARGETDALAALKNACRALEKEHGHYGTGHADALGAAILACQGRALSAHEAWRRANRNYGESGLTAFTSTAEAAFDPEPGWQRMFWPPLSTNQ